MERQRGEHISKSQLNGPSHTRGTSPKQFIAKDPDISPTDDSSPHWCKYVPQELAFLHVRSRWHTAWGRSEVHTPDLSHSNVIVSRRIWPHQFLSTADPSTVSRSLSPHVFVPLCRKRRLNFPAQGWHANVWRIEREIWGNKYMIATRNNTPYPLPDSFATLCIKLTLKRMLLSLALSKYVCKPKYLCVNIYNWLSIPAKFSSPGQCASGQT